MGAATVLERTLAEDDDKKLQKACDLLAGYDANLAKYKTSHLVEDRERAAALKVDATDMMAELDPELRDEHRASVDQLVRSADEIATSATPETARSRHDEAGKRYIKSADDAEAKLRSLCPRPMS